MTTNASRMPEDRLRAELLEIWKSLLESNELTIDDDFFERGGDSLLATELVLQTEQRLGISIPDSLFRGIYDKETRGDILALPRSAAEGRLSRQWNDGAMSALFLPLRLDQSRFLS
jgi:acyl carrier protein